MSLGFSSKLAKNVLGLAPKVATQSLSIVPEKLKMDVLAKLLTLTLSEQIKFGELDFLKGKWVAISVQDIGLHFELSFDGQLLLRSLTKADVTFTANVPELLLVAAAKEDPDTLFFQRKLRIEGDTELGLEVKNLLLGIELEALPQPVRVSIEKLAITLQTLQSYSDGSNTATA
ncbi:SCP2 sterol-binding domain-containing protein [Shewanella sp. 1_MG-2023]|jgi:predicted lipid carrier protein YhbT|uniref:Ubiquinone biosynthesis accessory factor UbiT n=1 Tax=Shewanella electrodiphila TaxID=934143 RepID=A0ABT0KLC3_9GAMM|nr:MULTISPECIES: SCP2 sterol-binding domain-containing protein [Shewanella]MCC4832204.1 SCP2 sterol-binding domain-containing protein [Shewanella sp. 10N.7]MCL1044623.1 SCP2 sterol-binding domain-containing protein [Shewanella electrodiphila]MDO6610302.1 SCP2 sterol-binding domain-containing protein [Shewanella sp. 7_MG-2023]MDO6770427.1 SCP2 sterol-binding domain-containing protein [Shewanella sp. 2_MG-2023]MDO6795875.1 SCP2 sterol-binding domain-containing protein [Shewanella sp. 1_MG-2023]